MKCANCGAEIALEDKSCSKCGAPRPQLSPSFAQAERRFATLRASYQAGTVDDATYQAALQNLIVQDQAGGHWMLGADDGEWYWHDGQQWVRRDPPLERPQARQVPPRPATLPERPQTQPASPPAAARPAGKELPWKWIAAGCGGLLVIAVVVAVGALAVSQLLPVKPTPAKPTAVAVAPTATQTVMPMLTPGLAERPVTAQIGSEGGEIVGPNGVRVIVPDGALPGEVSITVAIATDPPPPPPDVLSSGTPCCPAEGVMVFGVCSDPDSVDRRCVGEAIITIH